MIEVDCEHAQKLISLYLAGDLDKGDLEALMTHLASCSKCRAAFEEAKRYEAALKGVFRETVSKSRSPKSRVLRTIKAQGPRRPRGMSLGNWFVFILLMAALCFLIIVAYVSYEKLRQENIEKGLAAQAELKLISEALSMYRADHGSYPRGSNSDLVNSLQLNKKGGATPYFSFPPEKLKNGRLVDPWEQPYIYKSTGETALMYSTGPDRRDDDGLGDDVRP